MFSDQSKRLRGRCPGDKMNVGRTAVSRRLSRAVIKNRVALESEESLHAIQMAN